MKGVPFSNKRYTKGVPFLKKWYIKGKRLDIGAELSLYVNLNWMTLMKIAQTNYRSNTAKSVSFAVWRFIIA